MDSLADLLIILQSRSEGLGAIAILDVGPLLLERLVVHNGEIMGVVEGGAGGSGGLGIEIYDAVGFFVAKSRDGWSKCSINLRSRAFLLIKGYQADRNTSAPSHES